MKQDKKIKTIWWVHKDAVLPNSFGGTRHYDFSLQLANKNLRFVVIASGFNHYEKKEAKEYNTFFKVEKVSPFVTFVWLKTSPYKSNGLARLANIRVFTKQLKRVSIKLEPPDLIIGSSPHLLNAYQSYKLAKKFKVPFIFEVRDIWPQALVEIGINKFHPMIIYFRTIEKKLTRQSDAIVAVMSSFADYAKRFKVDLQKIYYVSNGVADRYIKSFSPPKEKQGKFVLTYAGTIGKAQNIENIVYTANRLRKYRDISFQIIGNGVEKAKLAEQAKALNLKNIVFLGPVSKNEISDVLRSSDALILSMKSYEIYKFGIAPNKIFDYLAAGRPIIFSSKAKNNFVAEASCGVTADPNSENALSKAVLKLYNCPKAERHRMGRNAISYVRKYYSISKLSVKLSNAISHLI